MNRSVQQTKFERMTTEPVEKLVLTLSVPTIISMLITSIYNMADTFFVGRINTSATAAVGVVFSLMAIIQAFGFMFGHGSGNYISRALGKQDMQDAAKMAATGFFSSFIFGALITIFGFVFLKPLGRILGATETSLPYVLDYLKYILIGAPFMTASFTLNNHLRFQGSATLAMVGITVGGLLNIALDPLFIFILDFGVSGAAIATVISQIVSFCILLGATFFNGNIRLSIRNFTPSFRYYKEIFLVGSPSLMRQGLSSIATVSLNSMAGVYGDAAVAAMSVVGRIMMFAFSALIGYGQGFQPICGFNFGAGLYDRIEKTFWFCVKTATAVLTVLSVAGYVFAPELVMLFRDDPAVIEIGTRALRAQCVTFPLCTWIVFSNMMTQNLRLTYTAMLLATARQGLFFIPVVLVLPHFLKMTGLEISQSISDVLTFVVALPLQLKVLRNLRNGRIKG